jgi:hypothetical protein
MATQHTEEHTPDCHIQDERSDPRFGQPCPRGGQSGFLGFLSCVQVHDLLRKLGVEDPERTSLCTRAAIQRGYIRIPEDAKDTDVIIFPNVENPQCKHKMDIKLKHLLEQDDYPGPSESGPIYCEYNDKSEIKEFDNCYHGFYATRLCYGNAWLEYNSKFHEHCDLCPGFGRCKCDCRHDETTSESESDSD